MKKLAFSAAASALAMLMAAASPAWAQRDNDNRGRGNQSDNRGNGNENRGRGNDNGDRGRGNENRMERAAPVERAAPNGGRAGVGDNRGPREFGIQDRRQQVQPQPQQQVQPQQQIQRQAQPQFQRQAPPVEQRGDFNRNDRRPDVNNNNFGRANDFNRNNLNANRWRYDPRDSAARRSAARDLQFFRRNFTSPNRFRVNVYIGPPGYSYRRWTYGQVLPRIYFARNYWISDFAFYGLEFPPPGYVWVRYGPDALLIDEFTGDIVEVVYNVFWW